MDAQVHISAVTLVLTLKAKRQRRCVCVTSSRSQVQVNSLLSLRLSESKNSNLSSWILGPFGLGPHIEGHVFCHESGTSSQEKHTLFWHSAVFFFLPFKNFSSFSNFQTHWNCVYFCRCWKSLPLLTHIMFILDVYERIFMSGGGERREDFGKMTARRDGCQTGDNYGDGVSTSQKHWIFFRRHRDNFKPH